MRRAGTLNLLRKHALLLAVAAILLAFGLLADEVVEGDTLSFDRAVLMWFRTPQNVAVPIGPLWLQEAVRDVTSLGSFSILGIITVVAVLQFLLSGDRRLAVYVGGAVVGGTIVSTVLKDIFDRPRPDIPGAPHVFTASFPSGHATLSAVVFLTLAAVLAAATLERRLKVFYLTIGIFLTLIVGVSRIYEGVHYPTDVLAGWMIGSSWAILCWVGAQYALYRRSRTAPKPLPE
jgi:undecaprenyl-diphosphatase